MRDAETSLFYISDFRYSVFVVVVTNCYCSGTGLLSGKLVSIVTSRDIRFQSPSTPLSDFVTTTLVTARESVSLNTGV